MAYKLDEFGAALTRKDLLNYLWEEHQIAVDIFKAGPQYVCLIGKTLHATCIRNLYVCPAESWADMIKREYFPF